MTFLKYLSLRLHSYPPSSILHPQPHRCVAFSAANSTATMPRRQRAVAFVAALVTVSGTARLQGAHGAGPPINLNIRRASSSTGGDSSPTGIHSASSQHASVSAAAPAQGSDSQSRSKQWGGVALDLSGEFSCHIASPSNVNADDLNYRPPLFCFDRPNVHGRTPAVHVGGKYDFSRAWYGVTRVFGSLTWAGKKLRDDNIGEEVEETDAQDGSSSSKAALALRQMQNNLSRCTMSIRAEKDLRKPNDGAVQLCLERQLDFRDEPYVSIPPSMTLRVESNAVEGETASVAIRTPIHRRVDIVSKSTVYLDFDDDSDEVWISERSSQKQTLTSRLPRVFSREEWETGAWLPDIRLSPTGWLAAKTEAGLPPLSLPPSGNIKTGVRLSVNRQVPWSIWGGSDDDYGDEDDEQLTWLKLQFCGTSPTGDTYYSASLDAAVERIVDSLRITLAQEKIVRSKFL